MTTSEALWFIVDWNAAGAARDKAACLRDAWCRHDHGDAR